MLARREMTSVLHLSQKTKTCDKKDNGSLKIVELTEERTVEESKTSEEIISGSPRFCENIITAHSSNSNNDLRLKPHTDMVNDDDSTGDINQSEDTLVTIPDNYVLMRDPT